MDVSKIENGEKSSTGEMRDRVSLLANISQRFEKR